MVTPQQRLTKAQQHSIEALCMAIRLIEELVPQEQKRSSAQRKRRLESAHETLRHHAFAFDITFPNLSLLYQPGPYLDHAHLVAEALTQQFASHWQLCEKTTPTRARRLSQDDYEARQGIIETREGSASFIVGDYLAQDELGEYPIQRTALEQHFARITSLDDAGWASYRSTERREARQQFRAFATDCSATGLAGDYLLRGQDGRTWPCAKTKFEREYRLI